LSGSQSNRAGSDLAARIHASSWLTGDFRLRSGGTSSEYFDKYRFESDPGLLRDICWALLPRLPAATEALAGLELGGVPIATVLSQLTGIPTVFVRKQRKDYGTRQLAEGMDVAGRRLVVIEDVVTTGGQIVKSIEDLRSEGATIEVAICVIDREAGAGENLAAIGVELVSLYRKSELS
jgi:orotate phosphoribosyltransferase